MRVRRPLVATAPLARAKLVGDLAGERVLDAHGARHRIGAAEADVAAGVDGERRGVGEHARGDVDRHPLGAPAEVEPHARGEPDGAGGRVELDRSATRLRGARAALRRRGAAAIAARQVGGREPRARAGVAGLLELGRAASGRPGRR